MQRAKSVTGLILQVLRTRWAALGSRGRVLVVVGLIAAAVAAVKLGACLFGGCAAGPCQLAAPCPYAAQAEEPPPPCHGR